jgi:hypothetical protein
MSAFIAMTHLTQPVVLERQGVARRSPFSAAISRVSQLLAASSAECAPASRSEGSSSVDPAEGKRAARLFVSKLIASYQGLVFIGRSHLRLAVR